VLIKELKGVNMGKRCVLEGKELSKESGLNLKISPNDLGILDLNFLEPLNFKVFVKAFVSQLKELGSSKELETKAFEWLDKNFNLFTNFLKKEHHIMTAVALLKLFSESDLARWDMKLETAVASCLVHDIGILSEIYNYRIGLPQSFKKAIKNHPHIGFELLKELGWLEDDDLIEAAFGVWQHHERALGRGYPLRLGVGDINKYAIVVAISEMYALVMAKSSLWYKKITEAQFLERIRGDATFERFYPLLIKKLGVLGKGKEVLLSNGEIGIVKTSGKNGVFDVEVITKRGSFALKVDFWMADFSFY